MSILAATLGVVVADERILSFSSLVEVQKDGSYIVTETIKVRSERRQIKRGIYRDFPTMFENASGRENKVGFKLLSAKRDGAVENTRIELASRAIRIYLGKRKVILRPGVYTYEIRYWTDRQLRRFDDRVEVYWNATGNFWNFPIDRAIATIALPDGAKAIETTYFTGPFGSTERNASSVLREQGNTVVFETDGPLGRREGLTVAVSFDKQFVTAPDSTDELRWLLQDHAAEIAIYGGTVLAFIYYLLIWMRIGRDPPTGIMVPRWELPQSVSPALVNYIENKGLAGKGFDAISSALLNLAVKGLVKLDEIGDSVTIRTEIQDLPNALPVGERALMSQLLGAGGAVEISKSNGSKIKAIANSFGKAMNGEHRSVFYKSNFLYLVPGLLISVAALVLALTFGQGTESTLGLLFPFLIVVVVVSFFAFDIARKWTANGFHNKIKAVFGTFFVLVIMANATPISLSNLPGFLENPVFLAGAATLVVVNVLFYVLMGAPTPLGRKRMDEIAGLKHYLTVAEKDRMNMRGAPEMSPAHYEKLLPYAVALNVEKPWSDAFQTWLVAAVAAGSAAAISYHGPGWHSGGGGFDGDRIGERMSSIGTNIADSLTASMPAPKSSSSGFSGGGSSGGGGGGGGGGGW